MARWRWPLPLAIGVVLQTLSQQGQLERSRTAAAAVSQLPDAALVSQFIAGALVFSGLAAVLLFAVHRGRMAVRRQVVRRRRTRHLYPGHQRPG